MNEELKLPPAISQYLRAVNSGDIDGFPSLFADDALVKDVERTIRGRDAIRKWARQDIFGVQARFEVVKVAGSNGSTVLTVKIDGTFDRSGLPDPLLMDHSFGIADGKITELKVTFASDDPGREG